MNGRIYDPLLGRFLSADLLVTKPGSLQSYNRYSYVQNNPLTLTDPSGFADTSPGDDNAKTGLAWLISVLAPDTNSLPQNSRSAPTDEEQMVNNGVRAGFDKGVQVIAAEAKVVDVANSLIPGVQAGKDFAQLATGKDMVGRDASRLSAGKNLALGAALGVVAGKVSDLAGKVVGKLASFFSRESGTVARLESKGISEGLKDTIKSDTSVAKEVSVDMGKHPETAQHVLDAQSAGHPDIVTIDRAGAAENRAAATGSLDKVPGKQLDEYPPAMFQEGGAGASVRPIAPADNMGAGASMGNQLRGVPDGAKVRIKVIKMVDGKPVEVTQ